jgi:PAS domain S-box-containing protein
MQGRPTPELVLPLFGRKTPIPSDAVLAQSRLAAIVESSDDAIISKGLDGTILSWNPGAERIFGYTRDEMVGGSVYTLIPPELHDEENHILQSISRGDHVPLFETIRRHKNGTLFPVAVSVSPVRDAAGTIVGAASIKRDLRQIRRGLEVSAHLAAIVQSSDDAILSKGLDGTVRTWNAAAERMYGFTPSEMIGRSIYQVVPPDLQGEEEQILERVSRGEHVAHYETVRRRKDGKRIDVSLTLSPIRDQTGAIVGASSIQRDITQRKRTEETLRQAAKMEAIGALAGGLAHDFNNQLYAVSGFAHFISRDPGLSPSTRQDLLELQKVTDRMASLTRQLLAFARQQVLTPETLDLNSAVDDTRPMLQRLIGSNIQIELRLAPGPKWVRADRGQLVQVLLNLVINARDAMSRGGPIVIRTATLEIGPGQLRDRTNSLIEAGAYAELAVIDSGEGIDPEHLPHIFEPFYTTKEVGMGTGLGLATVEGIIGQSGGHIQVESTVGRGTTIRLLLPLTAEPRATGSRPPVPRRAWSQGRILVVEDEDAVRTIVSRTLQSQGYEVLGAREGRQALELLGEVAGAIDLIIADVVMPGMGGVQLARELRKQYSDIPLVWMSGHPRETEVRDDEVAARQVFLHKPVAPDVLLGTVAETLGSARKGGR